MGLRLAVVLGESRKKHFIQNHDWLRVKNIPLLKKHLNIADNAHQATIDILLQELDKQHMDYDTYVVSNLDVKIDKDYDLCISVGGDGTFLRTSHFLYNTPLLGINSSPKTSVGYYCRFHLQQSITPLNQFLEEVVHGTCVPSAMDRLQIYLEGKSVGVPILNDILVSTHQPSESSRYIITLNHKQEQQCSSGIWIATAQGSSAAFASATGKIFSKHNSQGDRQFAFRVRELYQSHQHNLVEEQITSDDLFSITSFMSNGTVSIDGLHQTLPFAVSNTLTIHFHKAPLLLYSNK